MRRHAKAPSAGSTSGTGSSRRPFGHAFATRGASGDDAGSGAPSHRLSAPVVALLLLGLLAAVTATPALASKAQLNKFGTVSGGAGGQISTGTGVAVNTTGAGGVGTDEVYISDSGNNRVDEFTSAGSFVRAWGVNVVRTGPDNNATVNEVQTVTVKAGGGTFTLGLNFNGSTQTTAPIAYNAGAAQVESALQSLSNVGAIGGAIAVTGGPGDATGSTPYTLTFGGALAGTDIPALTLNAAGLAVAAGTTLTCSSATSATTTNFQWLRNGTPIGGATSSTYVTESPADNGAVIQCQVTKLNANAGSTQVSNPNPQVVSAPYPGTVPPGAPSAAIASPTLSSGGTLTVGANPTTTVPPTTLTCAPGSWTGSPAFSYQWYRNGVALVGNGATTATYSVQVADLATAAVFQCAVTGTNAGGAATKVSQNKATTAAPSPAAPGTNTGSPEAKLTAPTSAVATTTNGVPAFETCVAANGDVCQAGTAGSAIAGAVSAPEAVAVDQDTGNVFVAGNSNKRIDVFSAKGVFEGAFGWKVNSGTPEAKLQFCTAGTGCQAGEGSSQAGGFRELIHAGLAVDPSSGHLYIGDRGNLRVNEFGFALNGGNEVTGASFTRAFGGDVISGGAKGTATLNTNASFNAGSVITSEKTFIVGQEVVASNGAIAPGGTITGSLLFGASPPFNLVLTVTPPPTIAASTTLTATASPSNVPRNEQQTIMVTATGGTFTVKFASDPIASGAKEATTTPIPFNASALEFENALAGLANVGAGNVGVSGSAGGPYTVEFKGTRFADTNVSQLVAETGSLTGGTATVITTREGTSLEVCTAVTHCQSGSPGIEGGWFSASTPTSLAVDSGGFVYAVSAEGTCSSLNPCRVQKFNSDGSFKESFGPSSGGAAECQLTWTSGAANAEAPIGVAVDPANQHVLVTRKSDASHFEVCEFDEDGVLKDRFPITPRETNTSGYLTPAVGSTGNVYLNAPLSGAQGSIYVFGPIPAPGAEVTEATEVGQTSATLNGKVTVPLPGGEGFDTGYHFEYSGDNGLHWTRVPVPDASVPTTTAGTYSMSQTVSGLQPNLAYRVRLVACTASCVTSGEAVFTTLSAKPSISHTEALPVTGTTAKLNGSVNPNNSPTNYHFEWGLDTTYGNEAPDFEPFTGSGGQPVPVSATVAGLALDTTYHFRLVAANAAGTTFGPDATFKTNACSGLSEAGLPDCRGFELVSPADKRPVGTVETFAAFQVNYQSARDGGRIVYPMLNGLADATAGGTLDYLATRAASAWNSEQLTAPTLVPAQEDQGEENYTSRVLYNSSDLTCTVLESREPLTNDTPEADIEQGISNLYLRNEDGTYTLLTAPVPLDGKGLNKLYRVDWAASDCSHVLFETPHQLLPSAPATGGLYEWANGNLSYAGVLPDGTSTGSATAGAGSVSGTTANAISEDGSQMVFTATSDEGGDSGKAAIFVRKNGTVTVDVSQSKTAIDNNNSEGSGFEGATPDGSHVFIRGRYGLAPGASSNGLTVCRLNASGISPQNGEGCDLYDYDVVSETLTDLSADANPADAQGASVIGMIDASDDGSYVYFAARGQLIPGRGNTQAQNLAAPNGEYNIYLNHDGNLSFVGVMTGLEDVTSAPSGTNLAHRFARWVADATPDGRHLLFISRADVTGYPGGQTAMVYRYSASPETTRCVSCRPDGLPSAGQAGTALLTYQKDLRWGSSNLTPYRPRAMSADGRHIFFTSPDVLVPGGVSGARNVYEWEQGKVYLLAADRAGDGLLFADSSASGDDVFIQTRAALAPQDFDAASDMYDARVGGGVIYDPPPAPCEVLLDKCQPPAAPQPGPDGGGASEGFSAQGNPATPRPQPRPHKARRHRRKHRRATAAGHGGRRHANFDQGVAR